MLEIKRTSQFKKDLKKIKKQGKSDIYIREIVDCILSGESLDIKYDDHKLSGNYVGCRECKIKGDWLLIYYKTKKELMLMRTGSHSELF